MQLDSVTPPTKEQILELVSVAEMKAELRITQPDEDSLIESKIVEAYAYFAGRNGWLNRTVLTHQWRAFLPSFGSGPIELPLPPLQSVESVEYRGCDGAWQTAPAADYEVVTEDLFGYIVTAPGKSWPSTGSYAQSVRIDFTAGYGNAAEVKSEAAGIVRAVKLLTADYHANREATVFGPLSSRVYYGIEKVAGRYRIANDHG